LLVSLSANQLSPATFPLAEGSAKPALDRQICRALIGLVFGAQCGGRFGFHGAQRSPRSAPHDLSVPSDGFHAARWRRSSPRGAGG